MKVTKGFSSSAEEFLVRGEILFADAPPHLMGATIYVRLEDVTRLGAPADVVAEQVISSEARQIDTSMACPFMLHGKAGDPHASYSVRVHVDVDGDGRISSGDYITMESYPVLTHGNPDWVTVRVHRIG